MSADLLGFIVWLFAGGLVLMLFEQGFEWQWVVLAVLAVTALRVLPVFLALLGTGFRWQTVTFLGWFGPRGLASIVLGLVYYEELQGGGDSTIGAAVIATVGLSILAHGLSAKPGAEAYGRRVQALPPDAPEHAA